MGDDQCNFDAMMCIELHMEKEISIKLKQAASNLHTVQVFVLFAIPTLQYHWPTLKWPVVLENDRGNIDEMKCWYQQECDCQTLLDHNLLEPEYLLPVIKQHHFNLVVDKCRSHVKPLSCYRQHLSYTICWQCSTGLSWVILSAYDI